MTVLMLATASALALAHGQEQPQTTASATEDAKSGPTDADVVAMVKAGISESTILLAIENGPNRFDTSPAALIELKNQGVPDTVIQAMVRLAKPQSGNAAAGAKVAEGEAQEAAGGSTPAAAEGGERFRSCHLLPRASRAGP